MTRSPLFWLVVGAGGYWAVQHFLGVGTSGKSKKA
jgi:hypothetical protein